MGGPCRGGIPGGGLNGITPGGGGGIRIPARQESGDKSHDAQVMLHHADTLAYTSINHTVG